PRHRGPHRPAARGADVGGRGGRPGRDVLLHPGEGRQCGREPVILLVEDSEDDVELTLRALRRNAVPGRVEVARDGAAALDYLLGGPEAALPSVVLLDLNLPKVSGLEVLERLRAHPRTRLLPVVILTSSREQADLLRGYALGAT